MAAHSMARECQQQACTAGGLAGAHGMAGMIGMTGMADSWYFIFMAVGMGGMAYDWRIGQTAMLQASQLLHFTGSQAMRSSRANIPALSKS